MDGRGLTTQVKLVALAARERLVVSCVNDAHWFVPFLQAVLPAALGRPLDWNEHPSEETNILVETPLRSRDYGEDIHDACFRMLISGEPYSIAELTGYDLIVDTKDDEALRPSDGAFVYVPFYVTSFLERRRQRQEDLLAPTSSESARPGFAAFLYDQCLPHRELFFDALSSYRPVDALGKCRYRMGADGRCLPRATNRSLYTTALTYFDDAVERYRRYRFVVAVESARLPGYITEKLVKPMLAGAIPIYWGAPDVGEHFNTKSFVDVASFSTLEECVELVRDLDEDDGFYDEMLAEPWLAGDGLGPQLELACVIERLRLVFAA